MDVVAKASSLKAQVESLNGHLVAVSKKQSKEKILQAYKAGVVDFGENYLQEALEKMESLSSYNLRWHYIGSVQSGSLSKLINRFYMIQSLYKLKHIASINAKTDVRQRLLIQVKWPTDLRDNGVDLAEAKGLIEQVKIMEKINLCGLMFMPPLDLKGEGLVEAFKRLKSLFMELKPEGHDWNVLSMGMSGDYVEALENGASHVRIGSAVFGLRE